MTTDPIADLLTRIRNGVRARKDEIILPHSNIKMGILEVLKKKGFVSEISLVENGKFQEIKVVFNPEKGKINLKRISKPGQRIYLGSDKLKKIYGGLGVTVVSTSKGIMSGEEAKKMNIGGEILCEVF